MRLPYPYRHIISYNLQILRPALAREVSTLAFPRHTRGWQNTSLLIFTGLTCELPWVHSSRTICSCGFWCSELKRMNSLASFSYQRTFVFQGVGGNCREQHHLFLQDVEMPRKIGNNKSFWRIVTLWDCLEWTMSYSFTSSDLKMWYTYFPILSDLKTAFGNNLSPELQKHS